MAFVLILSHECVLCTHYILLYFCFIATVPNKGLLTKQILQIAQLLKTQPQAKTGKFSVNFQDVKNYIPESLASEMVPLNLKIMAVF